jgi:hypothetical protein
MALFPPRRDHRYPNLADPALHARAALTLNTFSSVIPGLFPGIWLR